MSAGWLILAGFVAGCFYGARLAQAALVLALAFLVAPAAAQPRATLLLRTVASECGMECESNEIAALHAVIDGTARREGVSYRAAWALLSPRLAAGTVSRRWTSHLDTSCAEPPFWPRVVIRNGIVGAHPSWSHYRERCEVLAVFVTWVLDGSVPSPCRTTPRAWGADFDLAAREPLSDATWVEADCGEGLSNHFGRWQ